MKIFLVLFAFFLALMLVQCTDNSVVPVQDEFVTKGPGGGGHTETATNNLSFPALLADGYSITPITAPSFTVPYSGPYTGVEDNLEWILANGPWYAQKVVGNVWQADYATVTSANISFIDWGDAIESVDPKINRPYRLELALYSNQYSPMTAYTMTELAFPSSPQETQGTNTTTYESNYAAVASPLGRLAVQKYEGDATFLTWNGTQWVGDDVNVTAFPPEAVSFAQELNVGGRLIYGASTGGWKPTVVGNYRITFYMGAGSTVNLIPAIIADKTAPETPKIAENNQPFVGQDDNLTYVDVQVTAGGGGGGGH